MWRKHISFYSRSAVLEWPFLSFGDTVKSDARKSGEAMDEYNNVDRREEPFCILHFRYRPKGTFCIYVVFPTILIHYRDSNSLETHPFAAATGETRTDILS